MKPIRYILYLSLSLLWLIGCTAAPEATLTPTAEPIAVATAVEPVEMAAPPTATLTPAPTATATSVPPTATTMPSATPTPLVTAVPPTPPAETATVAPGTTSTATATATPMPTLAPIRLAAHAISPANVHQIRQQNVLGWGEVDRIQYSPDGRYFAAAYYDGQVTQFLYDPEQLARPETIYPLSYAAGTPLGLTFDRQQPENLFVSSLTTVEQVQVTDETSRFTWLPVDQTWHRLHHTADGQTMIAIVGWSRNERVVLADSQSWAIADSFQPGGGAIFNWLTLSPDGRLVAATTGRGELHLLEVVYENGRAVALRHHDSGLFPHQTTGTFGYARAFFVTGVAGRARLELWWNEGNQLHRADMVAKPTMTPLPPVSLPGELITGVAVSPDGDYTAVAVRQSSNEHALYLWRSEEMAGGEPLPLSGQTGPMGGMAFSPDGRLLATGAVNGSIHIWHTGDGRLLRTLTGHRQIVSHLVFSDDGAWLTSGSVDQTVRVWGGSP